MRRRPIQLAGNIERQSNFIWQKKWTWTYGGRAARDRRARRVQHRRASRTRARSSSPRCRLSLGYDGSDSLLDPTPRLPAERPGQPRISPPTAAASLMRARSSTRAPIIRCRDSVVAAGRIRLGTIVGARRVRHRAVAALLFGRRRVGARLRLSAARPQGHGRRPDRRPRPRRVRARGAHPPQAVRRQFRDRAVLRRRLADHRADARTSRTGASRAGLGVALLFELRPDPHRRRRAAQPRRRATARSRSPSRSARLSDGRGGGRRQRSAAPPPAAAARLAAAAAQRAVRAVRRAAVPARRRRWSCSTPRPAIASSSTGIGRFETASGLNIRIGRIDGSIFGKSQLRNVARRRQQRRLPDLAQHQARLGARRVALQQACASTA